MLDHEILHPRVLLREKSLEDARDDYRWRTDWDRRRAHWILGMSTVKYRDGLNRNQRKRDHASGPV